MGKRITIVMVALLAVCVLSPPASAARRGVGVSVDTARAQAKAEARLRKAAAKANRAARSAGLRVTTADAKPAKPRKQGSVGAARRDAIKRAIRNRLAGGNLVRKGR